MTECFVDEVTSYFEHDFLLLAKIKAAFVFHLSEQDKMSNSFKFKRLLIAYGKQACDHHYSNFRSTGKYSSQGRVTKCTWRDQCNNTSSPFRKETDREFSVMNRNSCFSGQDKNLHFLTCFFRASASFLYIGSDQVSLTVYLYRMYCLLPTSGTGHVAIAAAVDEWPSDVKQNTKRAPFT